MKKVELQKQIELAKQEKEFYKKAYEKLNAERLQKQQEEWDRLRPKATEIFHKEMNKIFPEMVCKVTLEHIDSSGFWFTFELKNDRRRQTYVIRHTDMEVL